MRQIITIAIAVLLAACDPQPAPVDLSQAGIGVLAGCPILPGTDTVEITQRDGVDFRFCKYTAKSSGKLLFNVYVGEHPEDPESGLRFAGTTRANDKDIVWFSTPRRGRNTPRVWYTYLATGSPRGTVMVVTFASRTPEEMEALARLVAHLQISL
jgi:hypothetical protein